METRRLGKTGEPVSALGFGCMGLVGWYGERNDAEAKATVARVLDQFGWEAEDMGGAIAARAIEPLAILWCIPGFLRDSWTHAFHLLRS